ncbi:hypothetical protein EGW08_014557, partial [Elysia chlorotica]
DDNTPAVTTPATDATVTPKDGLTRNTDEPKETAVFAPVTLSFQMDLRFEIEFNPGLKDPASDIYQQATKDYETELTNAYRTLPNFKRVVILGFWEGSVGVRYEVEYGALDADSSLPLGVQKMKDELQKVKVELFKLPGVDKSWVNNTFNDAGLSNALVQLTEFGEDVCSHPEICADPVRYQCEKARGLCVHKCSAPGVCPH